MAEIFYLMKCIKLRNWRRQGGKCALASHESINTSITEICGFMWNQQPFHRFYYGYSWLYCQHWLLFAWKIQQYQNFYLWHCVLGDLFPHRKSPSPCALSPNLFKPQGFSPQNTGRWKKLYQNPFIQRGGKHVDTYVIMNTANMQLVLNLI